MEVHPAKTSSFGHRASGSVAVSRCSMLAPLLLLAFGLLLLSLVAGRWALVAAQDPGSMASRVQRPGACNNGEVLTYNSASQQYECQPGGGGGGVPAGAILLIVSGSCPSGYAEETSLDGRLPLGTLAAHADIGSTGGSDNTTPAGTVSQPAFTGDALAGHAHTFTGDLLAAHTHTFTGNALSGGARKGGTTNPASIIENGAAVTGSNSSDSAGTPAGTNSSLTAGTPSGAVSQPTFTGTQFDNRSAFVRVIFCRKT